MFSFLLEMLKHTAFHFYRVGIISMLAPWRYNKDFISNLHASTIAKYMHRGLFLHFSNMPIITVHMHDACISHQIHLELYSPTLINNTTKTCSYLYSYTLLWVVLSSRYSHLICCGP